MEAWQQVELTGTNSSCGLLIFSNFSRPSSATRRHKPSLIKAQEIELFVFRPQGRQVSGGYVGGATPVPIPNTEVKPSRADGTAQATVWESRSLPE